MQRILRMPMQLRGERDPSAERPVFCREGEYWTIAYDGAVLRLRDSKGLRYLAHLLRHAGERIKVIDLLETTNGSGADTDAEHARSAVSKRIKGAIAKIGQHHAALGYYFGASIKTGQQCAHRFVVGTVDDLVAHWVGHRLSGQGEDRHASKESTHVAASGRHRYAQRACPVAPLSPEAQRVRCNMHPQRPRSRKKYVPAAFGTRKVPAGRVLSRLAN